MFKVYFMADQETKEFTNELDWTNLIEDIAENTCWDIDIRGNVAIIDNGDPY